VRQKLENISNNEHQCSSWAHLKRNTSAPKRTLWAHITLRFLIFVRWIQIQRDQKEKKECILAPKNNIWRQLELFFTF